MVKPPIGKVGSTKCNNAPKSARLRFNVGANCRLHDGDSHDDRANDYANARALVQNLLLMLGLNGVQLFADEIPLLVTIRTSAYRKAMLPHRHLKTAENAYCRFHNKLEPFQARFSETARLLHSVKFQSQ